MHRFYGKTYVFVMEQAQECLTFWKDALADS